MSALQTPLVGQLARYEGTYRPHWEIPHVRVRVSRRRRLIRATVIVMFWLGVLWLRGLPLEGLLLGVAFFAVCLVVPAEEMWAPLFSPGSTCGSLPQRVDFEIDYTPTTIEFEGIVTALGRYGHKGCMERQVEIVRVLRYGKRYAEGVGPKTTAP
jgi:hypothetical protein